MSFVLKLTVDQISEKILFQSPQQKHLNSNENPLSFCSNQDGIFSGNNDTYKSTYRFDFNFVVFSCRGSRSFSTVYCKYTVRACFNNLKNLSICESGIKFPNIQLRKCESKKTNSRVSATYSKSEWKPRELYLKPNSTTEAIHLLISKMRHMKVS